MSGIITRKRVRGRYPNRRRTGRRRFSFDKRAANWFSECIMVCTEEIKLTTRGPGDVIDLTDQVQDAVASSGFANGAVTVFVPGSTGGITTIEYEPGLLKDLPEFWEKLIPSDRSYHHDETWHDGNGFSHLRAAMVGPDITVPFVDGRLTLGAWQQIVFLEFDNKGRSRRIVVQIIGE